MKEIATISCPIFGISLNAYVQCKIYFLFRFLFMSHPFSFHTDASLTSLVEFYIDMT